MRLSPHHRIHDGGPMYPRSISSPQSGHFRVSLIAPLCSAYRPSSATAAGERRWSARRASKLPATRKRKARRLFAAALWLGHVVIKSLLSEISPCRNSPTKAERKQNGPQSRQNLLLLPHQNSSNKRRRNPD